MSLMHISTPTSWWQQTRVLYFSGSITRSFMIPHPRYWICSPLLLVFNIICFTRSISVNASLTCHPSLACVFCLFLLTQYDAYSRVSLTSMQPLILDFFFQEQHGDSILQLNKFAIDKKLTLILTWRYDIHFKLPCNEICLTFMCQFSNREAAQYIEAYNSFENKSADALKERTKDDLFSQAVDCFTQIRHISAPNVVSLLQHFGVRGDSSLSYWSVCLVLIQFLNLVCQKHYQCFSRTALNDSRSWWEKGETAAWHF